MDLNLGPSQLPWNVEPLELASLLKLFFFIKVATSFESAVSEIGKNSVSSKGSGNSMAEAQNEEQESTGSRPKKSSVIAKPSQCFWIP